jgi:hypothetical protein
LDDYKHIACTGYVGVDGHDIILQNNPHARDSTSEQIYNFVRKDDTNSLTYNHSFQCGDFAKSLHDNSEAAGIKAGWVSIQFENNEINHACDVFNTTDRGLVFIDCVNGDTSVDLAEGKEYVPHSLNDPNIVYESTEIVKNYQIHW